MRTWHPTYNISIGDMMAVAGIEIHQQEQPRGHELPNGQEGLGVHHNIAEPRDWGMGLTDQEWLPGPGGLSSLGGLLQIA
eukprot:6401259-Karenia_brevis.AAC.1